MSPPSTTLPAIQVRSNELRDDSSMYPIEMEIEYRVRGGSANFHGIGQTISISSRDVFFRADCLLPVKSRIDLKIHWPVRLDEVLLCLAVYGTIVSSDETGTVVEIWKHEFRTRSAAVAEA